MRVAANEAVVDLVSDRSDIEEDDRACSSATGFDTEESKRQKRKRRGGRCEGAESKLRGKKAQKVEMETNSDDIQRYSRPDCVGSPIADYAAGYDLVTLCAP